MGRITPIMNFLRRVLVEEIYGRLSKAFLVHVEGRMDTDSRGVGIMFPDSQGWVAPADE